MKARKWVKAALGAAFAGLLACAGIVFVFDPFVQYHKPWIGKVAYDTKYERYINSGIARNYDYESINAGSSMNRQTLVSDLEKIMPKPIKLCKGGVTAREINIILNHALKYKKIKTIFLSFDLFTLDRGKDAMSAYAHFPFPFYLYDDNILNDYEYLFSFDTLKYILKNYNIYKSNKNKFLFDYNHMYYAQPNPNGFDGSKRLDWYYKAKRNKKEIPALTSLTYNLDGYAYKFSNLNLAKESFEYNYISLIKENPNTKFIIFYPPYSVLVYKDWQYISQLDEAIEAKRYFTNEFLKYPNVELYDFQDDDKITTDLNLYSDMSHYHPKINVYIIERIAAKDPRYLVDPATYDERLAHFKKYVSEYKTKFDEE